MTIAKSKREPKEEKRDEAKVKGKEDNRQMKERNFVKRRDKESRNNT